MDEKKSWCKYGDKDNDWQPIFFELSRQYIG